MEYSMKKEKTEEYKAPHLVRRFIAYYKPHKSLLALDMLSAPLVSAIGMVYPVQNAGTDET